MKLSRIIILVIIIAISLGVFFSIFLQFFYVSHSGKIFDEVIVEKKLDVSFVPENLSWVKVLSSAPWAPRDSGAVFLFQNKMWLMGGLNGNGKVGDNNVVEYWAAPHFNDIWNTEDGLNWQLLTSSSAWAPRRSMSVVVFKNKLWMFGGWSPINGYVSDVWVSDDGINWRKIIDNAAFSRVEGQTALVFKNKIWIIGGVNYSERQTKNDVWYSEDGIDWIKVENIPWQPRWDHAVAVFKDKLFLTGGMNLDGQVFNDVWVSENGINWTLLNNNAPWASRQGHALLVYKDKLWLIGRLNDLENGGSNDVWFSDDGIIWQKVINDPQWLGREDFFSIVFRDKIWVFGGMDINWQWRNDIWVSEFIKS